MEETNGSEGEQSLRSTLSINTLVGGDSEAMALAQSLCARIHDAGDNPSAELMGSLRDDLRQLHVLVQADARRSEAERQRFLVEKDVLRQEMHAEQVDREANAARVAERQRFLFERAVSQPGQAAAGERAVASASFVEAALASLCPHITEKSPGSAQLAEM
jgi:hypothetical protein